MRFYPTHYLTQGMRFYLTQDIDGNPVVRSVRNDEVMKTYTPEERDEAAEDVRRANISVLSDLSIFPASA